MPRRPQNPRKSRTRPETGRPESPRKPDRQRPRPTTRAEKPLPKWLELEEVERLYGAIKKNGSARDLAMFGLMYRYGLRAEEVTRLRIEDVDLGAQRVYIRRAKAGESKRYILPPDIGAVVKRYLRRRIDRGGFLFTTREATNQEGVHVSTVQRLFKEYAAAAGLPKHVSSHSLRHSVAVHTLAAGLTLSHVADLLGHKSTRSTGIYARIVDRSRDAMIHQLAKSREIVRWS